MIGKEAEEVLNRAVRFAFERRHEYFTLEHVLLSLLEEAGIEDILKACGGRVETLRAELEKYLDSEVPKHKVKAPPEQQSDSLENAIMQHPVATLSIQRMVQRALFHVQSAGKDEITPEDLLVAMFQSKDSFAQHVLEKQGIKRLDVIAVISHGGDESSNPVTTSENLSENSETAPATTRPRSVKSAAARATASALDQFATDLNERARLGKIDPLIGRALELERMVQVLCRRQKNNPLLVGEAGVGKTALAEGLAVRVVEGEVPEILKNVIVYSLDMSALLAGAKFRGDFESRFKKVLSALEAKREAGMRPVVLIDEIHTIIGAGAVTGSVMDASNMLKPLLSRGEIQVIGSTTYKEYRNVFEKDSALARRFQKIEVPEPSQEDAVQILEGLKPRYEDYHHVRYSTEAIRAAVQLTAKHIHDRFLPDKAIDIMDEVGAQSRLKRAGQTADVSWPQIEAVAMEEMIAKIARIPARSVSSSQKTRLKNLERDLKMTIFGQDEAIESVVTAIRLSRSGLRAPDKPIGSFLFCGPTGVGKTELTKQLALSMGVPFLRFDMSEYMEKHTVSRLIGAPPGYVGFEQAGLLTDAVLKNPHSVVLLDEIEKAHFDIWNILLQIMDHGTLTDNNGRKVDFKNSIIVLTSNVGSRELDRGFIGDRLSFEKDAETKQAVKKLSVSKPEVERAFSPEFRNRLDSVVYFNALDPVTIAQVVGKQIAELESQLLAKKVEIEIDGEVREWLAVRGYDRKLGARPMARLIQDRIKKPLSEHILFGALEHGGKVRLFLASQTARDFPRSIVETDPQGDIQFVIDSARESPDSSDSDETAAAGHGSAPEDEGSNGGK